MKTTTSTSTPATETLSWDEIKKAMADNYSQMLEIRLQMQETDRRMQETDQRMYKDKEEFYRRDPDKKRRGAHKAHTCLGNIVGKTDGGFDKAGRTQVVQRYRH